MICAWCKRTIELPENAHNSGHGICKDCMELLKREAV